MSQKHSHKAPVQDFGGIFSFTRIESSLAKNVQMKMLELGNALWHSLDLVTFNSFTCCISISLPYAHSYLLRNYVPFAMQKNTEKLGLQLDSVTCLCFAYLLDESH